MSVKRSPDMVLVGYFLARCGRRTESESLPPTQLGTDHWNRTYAAFFASLGGWANAPNIQQLPEERP